MAFVITKWSISEVGALQDGNYVYIKGRQGGLLSWLLSLVGVDPSVSISVGSKTILFEKGSLAGFDKRVIPVGSVCSTYYGYTKPWLEAVIVGSLLLPFFGLGLVVGPLYYFLNKTTSFGFVENSDVVNGIQFKRSVIEGKNISEKDALKAISIIQSLLEQSNEGTSASANVDALTGLNQLYNQGIITAEEFEEKRKKLLRYI